MQSFGFKNSYPWSTISWEFHWLHLCNHWKENEETRNTISLRKSLYSCHERLLTTYDANVMANLNFWRILQYNLVNIAFMRESEKKNYKSWINELSWLFSFYTACLLTTSKQSYDLTYFNNDWRKVMILSLMHLQFVYIRYTSAVCSIWHSKWRKQLSNQPITQKMLQNKLTINLRQWQVNLVEIRYFSP